LASAFLFLTTGSFQTPHQRYRSRINRLETGKLVDDAILGRTCFLFVGVFNVERFASPTGESGRSPLRPVWCMRLLCGVLVDAANALPTSDPKESIAPPTTARPEIERSRRR
jgi:hypothetical protein